jgi:hypothetical protein
MAERLTHLARTQPSWVRVLERGIIFDGQPCIRFAVSTKFEIASGRTCVVLTRT